MPPLPCNHRGFLRPTKATPLGLAPPRQARIRRHRVRMTTRPEPGRLPSDRLRPCGRSDRIALAITLARSSLAPLLLAAIRPGPVKRRGGRFKLPLCVETSLAAPPGVFREDASHRCLQPTYDTSTLRTVRFPACASVGLAAPFVRRRAARAARRITWVEHRLTATLQLRLLSLIVSRRDARVYPEQARPRYRSVLAGAAIDGPSGGIPRPRCFRPRAESAT